MKLDEWGSLLISWANFLDPKENFKKLEEICASELFPRLFKILQSSDGDGNSEDYMCFLRGQYSSLDLKDENTREATALQATAFLIYCSLHHPNNDLQQKMIELPHLIQCQITDFLQEFIDVPKSKITKELIFSKISEMCNISSLESSSSHLVASPKFGTPVTYTSSPSSGEIMGLKSENSAKKTSRIKKLRNDIERLNVIKTELSEELDSAKEFIEKLESDLKKKDADIAKLKSERNETQDFEHVCVKQTSNANFKVEKLKASIENLEKEKTELQDNLMKVTNEKEGLYEELKKTKSIIQKAELQRKLADDVKSNLEEEIANLKSTIDQLTFTNKEQSEYISELTKVKDKDDSICLSDSQLENVILPESLGHVIDLQVRELQQDVENKEMEISELKKNIISLNNVIEENLGTINKQSVLLKNKDSELDKKNCQIKCLEESSFQLNSELESSLEKYKKFMLESEDEFNKVKAELKESQKTIAIISEEKIKLEGIIDSYAKSIRNYEDEIKDLNEISEKKIVEIGFLKSNLEELQKKFDNSLKLSNEEINNKNEKIDALEDSINAWVNRNMELNSLLDNLSAEIEEKSVTIKNNETDLRNLECQNLFLTNTLQEKDSIINSMQTSINSMSGEILSLKRKESLLIAEVKTSDCRKTDLESKISELNQLLNSSELEKKLLSKTVEDKETEIQQQINKLKDMKTDFEIRKRKIETDLEQKEKEYMESEEDRCRLNINLDDLKHKYLFLEMKMKEKEQEAIESCQMILKLEADIKKMVSIEKDLNSQIKVYSEDLKEAREEIETSKAAISELQEEVSQLLSEAEIHRKDEFNLRNQISKNLDIINSLRNELNDAHISQKKLGELHCQDKQSMESLINELKLSLIKLNDDLVVSNDVNDVLTKDLTERNETISNLQDNLKSLHSEILSVKEENFKLTNDVLSKDIIVGKLQKNIDSCINEMNSVTIEREHMSLELTNFKEKYNLEVKKIEDLNTKISEYSSKLNELANELSMKDKKISNLYRDYNELSVKKVEMEDITEVAENQVRSLKEELHSVETHKLALEKELKLKTESLERHQWSINDKDMSLNLVLEKNIKLKKDKEFAETRCSRLEYDILVLREKINDLEYGNAYLKDDCAKKDELVKEYSLKYEELLTKTQSDIKKLEENYATEKSKLITDFNNLMINFENLKDEKEKLFKELKCIEMDHSSCGDRIKNAETLLLDMKDKEIMLNCKVVELREKEQVLNKAIHDKELYSVDLGNEISCLKRLVSTYEVEEGILKTKLETNEADIVKLYSRIDALIKEAKINEDKYEEELNLKVKKIQDLDSTIGKLNSHYIQVSKEKESLIMEIERKKLLESDLKSLEAEFQCLKEERDRFERESILKNEEVLQLSQTLSVSKDEIHLLKTERENENKIMLEKINELDEAKTNMKILQNDALENKMKEKTMIEQLVIHNDMIVSMEKNLSEFDKKLSDAEIKIGQLKDSIQKKEEALENTTKEYNCLKLDFDILSKKNEMALSHLEVKKKEIQELCDKLNEAQTEVSKLKIKINEQNQTIDSLYGTLHNQNIDINERNKEIDILQKEIKKVIQQLSEERNTKQNQIQKLKADKDVQDIKLKNQISEDDYKDHIEQVKSSYEKKVHTLKALMKKQFTEKLEDLTSSLQNENTDLKEKLLKEQERCARLQSELWNASDKLLISQEQNRNILTNLQNRNVYEVLRPSEPLSPLSKTRSMEVLSGRNRGIDNFARDISLNESESSRRSSIRSLPRGMGKKFSFSAGRVFPAAEEDGEVFDNRYLADLKAGRCDVQFDPNRMSTLQYRNSLCPPHLKSSYPAETQFISSVREDDIKVPSSLENEKQEPEAGKSDVNAGACASSAHSESDVRKTKVQVNEKTCPSTPYSGPNSYTLPKEQPKEKFMLGDVEPKKESFIKPIKPSTPSRLKALFISKKDENTPKRKSFFRRS